MSYLSLSFALGDLNAERAEQACCNTGALSVTFSDLRDDAVLEPAVGEVRLWPATRLQALFMGDADGAALRAQLQQLLGLDAAAIQTEIVADRVWEREWLRDFHAMRFGQRLWVCPHHETVTAADAVVVKLDPGMAFGTGTHASTALCLEWLDAHLARGMTVIDYGCGSGILAIAALKLGAAHAMAFDIDPQALIATLDNAERNNVAATLTTVAAATALQPAAELVLANILAGTLIELADSLATLVRPGGQIVLAGILAEQEAAVALAFAPCFDIRTAGQREGWVLLAGSRLGARHTTC
jgi:ribosomal protein L11 methyltransferase